MEKNPFEDNADRYDEWFEKNRHVYESEINALKILMPEGTGIEIGLGTGRFAEPLGIDIGIEPSENMRGIAIERGLNAIKSAAEEIPFEDETYDFALMVTTICFLDDTEKALREAHRIIKKGGHIVIGFVDKESRIGRQYLERKNESLFYRFATFYSVDEVVRLLESAGFTGFEFVQTLFKDLRGAEKIEKVKEGYGEGSFVVIKGVKV